jgi:hypothetical protein
VVVCARSEQLDISAQHLWMHPAVCQKERTVMYMHVGYMEASMLRQAHCIGNGCPARRLCRAAVVLIGPSLSYRLI